jgi:nicotinamidase-related amidase
MASLELDPGTTALVLIDLQQGIVAGQTAPPSADDVLAALE